MSDHGKVSPEFEPKASGGPVMAHGVPQDFFADADDISAVVHMAIGAGSVCWESLSGAGVFQDQKATEVGRQAVERINYLVARKAATSRVMDAFKTSDSLGPTDMSDEAGARMERDNSMRRARFDAAIRRSNVDG